VTPRPDSPVDDDAFATALAARIAAWSPDGSPAVAEAGRALALALAEGHVCLQSPELDPWLPALRASPLVGQPATVGLHPLVLAEDGNGSGDGPVGGADGPRLYLRRDFELESDLALRLARLARVGRLSLVSGGPGSGKTTRVARMLVARLEASPGLRIGLAAPTGKAAARLTEVMQQHPESARLAALGPVQTLHRVLEARAAGRRGGAAFGRHRSRPLALDLLVVDESSMLDLGLAAALLDALPADGELLLVGDPGQLAAVEAGAVFAELCAFDWSGIAPGLHLALTGSHRYAADSPVAALAAATRQGDARAVSEVWQGLSADERIADDPSLQQALASGLAPYVQALRADPPDPAALHAARRRFMVLAAQHAGQRGTAALNRRMSLLVQQALAIRPPPGPAGIEAWPGRPVLLQRNDAALGLVNGDVGIVLPAPAGWDAVFEAPGGGLRRVALERLPAHDTGFAVTVHKAQGSEADTVLVVLPEPNSPLARREWIYTAVTRARRRLLLAGTLESLIAAVTRPTPRHSGLSHRLRDALRSPLD